VTLVEGAVTLSESHFTTPAVSDKTAKPSKPYPDYPLTAHPARYGCKKIRGKLYYFGPWADPDGALAKYLDQKDALHAGRKPRDATDGVTVQELCNQFLNAKAASQDAGELVPHSWQDYKDACDLLVSYFGKGRLIDLSGLRSPLVTLPKLIRLSAPDEIPPPDARSRLSTSGRTSRREQSSAGKGKNLCRKCFTKVTSTAGVERDPRMLSSGKDQVDGNSLPYRPEPGGALVFSRG
jgi:hypothetical protein